MKNNKLILAFLVALATASSAISAMSWGWKSQEKPVAEQIVTAIEKGDTSTLFQILEMHSVDLNQTIPYKKRYSANNQLLPIEIAILENKPAVVELLLQKGADANKGSVPNRTLIGLAIHHNNQGLCDTTIIESLLNHGADAGAYNFDGYNALHAYCSQYKPLARIIKRLSERGSINNRTRSTDYYAPLHLPALNLVYADDVIACLEILLEIGADPNPVDARNKTPLDHVLKSWGQLQLLLSSNSHGTYSLRISNCRSAARLLLIHGAHANECDITAYFNPEELGRINQEIAEHQRILHAQLAAHTRLPHDLCGMTVDYCDPCFYQEQKEAEEPEARDAHDHRRCVIS